MRGDSCFDCVEGEVSSTVQIPGDTQLAGAARVSSKHDRRWSLKYASRKARSRVAEIAGRRAGKMLTSSQQEASCGVAVAEVWCGWGRQASEITRLGQVWMAALCQGCRRPFSRAVYRSQSLWRPSQRISGARLARTGSSCWGDRQASPTLRQVVGKIVIREQSRRHSERRRRWAVIITTQIFLPPLPHDMQRWQTSLQEFSMHDMSAESSRHPPRATRRACA